MQDTHNTLFAEIPRFLSPIDSCETLNIRRQAPIVYVAHRTFPMKMPNK